MSVSYYYANFTKRERLAVNAFGGEGRVRNLGLTLASRAVHLMLIGDIQLAPAPGRVGRWNRDSIGIVDDSGADFLNFRDEFVDIAANAILLVFDRDGFAPLADAAEHDRYFFMELCHLVVTNQAPKLEPHLRHQFGIGYLGLYREHCSKYARFTPIDLVPDDDHP